MTQADIYYCKTCGSLIGGVVIRNGTTGLLISLGTSEIAVVVYRLHGWCECGGQIHWESGKANNRIPVLKSKKDI